MTLCREDPEPCLLICPHRESEEERVDDFEGEWPAWKVWLYGKSLRLRCLGLLHKFDEVDTGGPWSGCNGYLWYCTRCYVYERDEEFVLSGPWSRLLWHVGGYRLYSWWHSWAWRFER